MAYSDGERRCANIISNPALPFRNLVDLRSGGVHILLIFTSFTNALPWITNSSLLWKEQEFYHKDIHIVVPEKKSRLCAVLPRRCWATKPYLSRSCIVLVPCQLRHDSVWNRLNPFESVTDNKCVLKESRLCAIFAASMFGNQTLILFLGPVSFYTKPVNNLEIFHLVILQSIAKE